MWRKSVKCDLYFWLRSRLRRTIVSKCIDISKTYNKLVKHGQFVDGYVHYERHFIALSESCGSQSARYSVRVGERWRLKLVLGFGWLWRTSSSLQAKIASREMTSFTGFPWSHHEPGQRRMTFVRLVCWHRWRHTLLLMLTCRRNHPTPCTLTAVSLASQLPPLHGICDCHIKTHDVVLWPDDRRSDTAAVFHFNFTTKQMYWSVRCIFVWPLRIKPHDNEI